MRWIVCENPIMAREPTIRGEQCCRPAPERRHTDLRSASGTGQMRTVHGCERCRTHADASSTAFPREPACWVCRTGDACRRGGHRQVLLVTSVLRLTGRAPCPSRPYPLCCRPGCQGRGGLGLHTKGCHTGDTRTWNRAILQSGVARKSVRSHLAAADPNDAVAAVRRPLACPMPACVLGGRTLDPLPESLCRSWPPTHFQAPPCRSARTQTPPATRTPRAPPRAGATASAR